MFTNHWISSVGRLKPLGTEDGTLPPIKSSVKNVALVHPAKPPLVRKGGISGRGNWTISVNGNMRANATRW
jgi:hypothetical protein